MAEHNRANGEFSTENNKSRIDIENLMMISEDSNGNNDIIDRADRENSESLVTSNGDSLTVPKSDVEIIGEKEVTVVLDFHNHVINGIKTENNGDCPVVENGNLSQDIGETEEKEATFVENQGNNNSIKLNGDSVALNKKGNEGKYETVTNTDEEKGKGELEIDDSTVDSNGYSLLSVKDTEVAAKPDQDEDSKAEPSCENGDVKETVVDGEKIDNVSADSNAAMPNKAPKPVSEESSVQTISWKDVAVNGMKSVPHKAQSRITKPMVRRYAPKFDKFVVSANNSRKSESKIGQFVADSIENKNENEIRGGESVSSHIDEESKNGSEVSESIETAVQSTNMNKDEEAKTHEVTRHLVYKVRVPKLAYEERQKEISSAKSVLDEKTKFRDCIYEEKLEQDARRKKCKLDYDAKKLKENNARVDLYAKNKELDSVKKRMNPMVVADIDNQIEELTIRQQYESMPFYKEKEIMKKIQQLEQKKKNLISKQEPHAQNDVIKQREEHEKQFKELKKEVGYLKALLLKAENNSKSALDNYVNEDNIFRSFKEKQNAANEERQKAYLHWMELKTQSYEKARCFNFRDEQSAIDKFKFAGDTHGLISYCNNQVEKFLEHYNNDTEFRNEYVKAKIERTIKRLGALDGRSLGPNEESFIPHHPEKSSPNVEPAAIVSSIKPEVESDAAKGNIEALKKQEKENKPKKEEDEKMRKEEQMRKKKEAEEEKFKRDEEAEKEKLSKEKEAAELRERIIAEEKEKMRKAEERKKKKKAAKAQKRAEYKAQKEAEEKEKKKAKEHKKQCEASSPSSVAIEVSTSSPDKKLPEASKEPETSKSRVLKEKNKSVASRQPKKKLYIPKDPLPLPPAFRNKRKRTMKWMWTVIVVLVVLVLFVAGNYISFET